MCTNPLFFYLFQSSVGYVFYPSLSVSCHSDMFSWHTWVYTRAQIHPSIVTPIPGFNQSAKINPQLIQSHNQAGWSCGILNPPAGKSPALILHLIWNEFTPGCGRNTAQRSWVMWGGGFPSGCVFPSLSFWKGLTSPEARAFSNTLLTTSQDWPPPPPSRILGYHSSQTPLRCCRVQSCLFICMWQHLNPWNK